jgi:hypothetical protein
MTNLIQDLACNPQESYCNSGGTGILTCVRTGDESPCEELVREHGAHMLTVARHFIPTRKSARTTYRTLSSRRSAFCTASRGTRP